MPHATRHPDRRQDPRAPVERPVKLRCRETGRYYSGRTTNLSAGGARLIVAHPSLLVNGQRVEIGIAWTSRDVVLSAGQLVGAAVVRSVGLGGSQQVALRFDARQPLAASA